MPHPRATRKLRVCRNCGNEKLAIASNKCNKRFHGIKCGGKMRVKVEGKRNRKKLGDLN